MAAQIEQIGHFLRDEMLDDDFAAFAYGHDRPSRRCLAHVARKHGLLARGVRRVPQQRNAGVDKPGNGRDNPGARSHEVVLLGSQRAHGAVGQCTGMAHGDAFLGLAAGNEG
jgi:hypothetical protein